MNNNEYIQIKVHKEEIRRTLKKVLNSEHSELISQVIIDNLSTTEVGLKQLYNSFAGLKDEFSFKVGERLLVKRSDIYSWGFDDEKTKQAGILVQGNIPCIIVDIIKTAERPYVVKYKYLNPDGKELQDSANVHESALSVIDQYPLDM